MQNLLKDLEELLQEDDRLTADGKLLKNKVIEVGLNLDPKLLKLLKQNDRIKKHFFQEVDDTLVFDKVKFMEFVNNKQFLPDSYTQFNNKIGLTADKEYLTESKEVVLSWPYKDCVLEGGQTKEDQQRDEIFWNETLAPDEIDRLLSPKVLTNFKKFDKDGEHKATNLSLNDNLILKGNNLLALHSLKKVYAGLVKLIYIDPPYNTDNSGFNYNDSFSHSTWMTYMKNRVEFAKSLLSEDGILVINSDEIEHSYLKSLTDEIFGRDNFKGDFIWQKRKGGGNDSHFIALDHDYLTVHTKNGSKNVHKKKWRVAYNEEYLKRYKEVDENGNRFYWDTLSRSGLQNPIVFEIETPDGDYIEVKSQKSKETIKRQLDVGEVKFTKTKNGWSLHHRVYMPEGKVARSILDNVGTNKTAGDELKALFRQSNFKYPKPEKLIRFLIDLFTIEGDIVLDFFVGSGTTAAVAHKMNRQFIVCEQLDYINTVTVERIKKVINGEKGGISEELEWQGGGSFMYAELEKANAIYSDRIEEAKSTGELEKIWEELQSKSFISYKIDPQSVNENKSSFKELTLKEQKQFLIEILDKNQLYVNYADIEDKDYGVSKEDKKLNRKFYKMK